MARGIANRFGTQPAAAAPVRRGGGGGNRNRGGGGRRGTPARKLPNTPLYGGKAGKAYANENPEAFINDLMSRAGMTDFSGTPYGDWSNTALPASILAQYGARDNQRLGISDWVRRQYGAGWGKKKGFNAGNLSAATGPLAEQYVDYQSNVDPYSHLTTRATKQGAFIPGGGNQEFQAAFQTEFIPQVQAELETARAKGQPELSMADFIAGRDLASEARRWYAMRPSSRRQPGPISPTGRYSWWD